MLRKLIRNHQPYCSVIPADEVIDTSAKEMPLKDWRLKILLVFISCDEKRKCMINWLMCKVKAYSKHPITESNNDIKEIKVRQNVWNVG